MKKRNKRTDRNRVGVTLEDLGQDLGMTREGVRLIEEKALATLRKRCIAMGLYPEGYEPPEPKPPRNPDLPEGW